MNALRLWFAGRSPRERRLVLVAAALAVAVLIWAVLLRPLGDALSAARTRQGDAAARLAETSAAVDAIRAGTVRRPPVAAASLADAVRASADRAGFALASMEPAGGDRVRVGIASAKGGALIAWLAGLEREGVLVEAATLTDHGDRTLGVQLTLRAGGR